MTGNEVSEAIGNRILKSLNPYPQALCPVYRS
jgi:hypothetical protein